MWWQSNTNGNKSQSVKCTHTGKQQKLTHAFFSQDSCWKHVKGLCHFIPSSSPNQVVQPGCTCPVSDSLPLGGWVPWVPGWAPEWPAIGIGDAADSDLVLALWPLAKNGGRNLANIWWCYSCDHTDSLAWHTLTILDIWIWSHFPSPLNQQPIGASSFRCLTSSDSAGSSFPWHTGHRRHGFQDISRIPWHHLPLKKKETVCRLPGSAFGRTWVHHYLIT